VGEQVVFTAGNIKKHADELRKDIAPKLEEIRTTLNDGATIEGGDFSITGTMCSMAYPGALQFAFEDMETHKKMIEDFADKVETTAKNYEGSEQASTLKKV
jgi:hypothetical protein